MRSFGLSREHAEVGNKLDKKVDGKTADPRFSGKIANKEVSVMFNPAFHAAILNKVLIGLITLMGMATLSQID